MLFGKVMRKLERKKDRYERGFGSVDDVLGDFHEGGGEWKATCRG